MISMQNWKLFLVMAFVSAALHIEPAHARACTFPNAQNAAPVVNINRSDGRIEHNNSRTRQTLRQMRRNSGHADGFGSNWTPVGLTLTELKFEMRIKVEAFQLSNRHVCARLSEVDADLGYDLIRVFIARRFRPGSCAYNSISQHEMNHVAVFRRGLDDFYPRLQRRLQRAAGALTPIEASSPGRAAKHLRSRLTATVEPLFKEMNRTLDRNNARLDTPERYRAEQARCSEW